MATGTGLVDMAPGAAVIGVMPTGADLIGATTATGAGLTRATMLIGADLIGAAMPTGAGLLGATMLSRTGPTAIATALCADGAMLCAAGAGMLGGASDRLTMLAEPPLAGSAFCREIDRLSPPAGKSKPQT